MADLIDRNFVLSEIEEEIEAGHGNPEDELINKGLRIARKRVALAPAAEAEPVRHGYWIECDYTELRHGEIWTEHRAGLCCSVCRTGFKKSKMTYKQYCGACGAEMDGGAENG